MPDQLMTPRQAAEYLHVSTDQLRGFVHDGALRYVNVGRGKKRDRMMFTSGDLDEFVERRTRSRRVTSCLSTSLQGPRSTGTISSAEVVGFTARRNERRNAKPQR
jgi:excisionase family DNA binding protein